MESNPENSIHPISLNLSGPALSVVRQARGRPMLRGPDAKNQS